MIYISAQPDSNYFIWQLEIQLRNLHDLGINKKDIQVLFSFDKNLGLKPDLQKFIDDNNHLAQFYIYPDLRKNPKYTSTIRPNILKQHFAKYPELSQATIMYHDSDILFSRLPQINEFEENEICFVSDTRSYLDVNYIRATSSEELLNQMLQIVGLKKEKLIQENDQTGGAQYILKGITSDFWEKVEKDCEELYVVMNGFNKMLWEKEYPTKKEFKSKRRGIQAWCADMWAVLWNLWLNNKEVRIHPEMAFSWPYNSIEDWNRLAIQHYSGRIEDKTKYFKKNEYLNFSPWYDEELDIIPRDNCSYEIVKLIKKRRIELDLNRLTIKNKAIILKEENVHKNSVNNFLLYKKYIAKYLNIKIFYMEIFDDFYGSIYVDPISLKKVENFKEFDSFLIIPLTLLIDVEEIKLILDQQEIKQFYTNQNAFKADQISNSKSLSDTILNRKLYLNMLFEN